MKRNWFWILSAWCAAAMSEDALLFLVGKVAAVNFFGWESTSSWVALAMFLWGLLAFLYSFRQTVDYSAGRGDADHSEVAPVSPK